VTAAARRLLPATLVLLAAVAAGRHPDGLSASPAFASTELRVTWDPARPRAGDAVLLRVRGAPAGAIVDAVFDGHPLGIFPSAEGHAAVVGIDMDTAPGARAWRVTATTGAAPATAEGQLVIAARSYRVQHLTVARGMVELDPETERRAVEEGERLRLMYRTISGARLWRGRFVRPVTGTEPGTGFGARRLINGQPRAPHSGIDFAAPAGTPVVAANRGQVAVVGEFFFPGRLVVLDHGLGLHTAYFHLDRVAVTEGQLVARGETLGTVGMTGRVTGPHLHFGAQVGAARIDPAALLGLRPVADARD
jgi:hypothetical protein